MGVENSFCIFKKTINPLFGSPPLFLSDTAGGVYTP